MRTILFQMCLFQCWAKLEADPNLAQFFSRLGFCFEISDQKYLSSFKNYSFEIFQDVNEPLMRQFETH